MKIDFTPKESKEENALADVTDEFDAEDEDEMEKVESLTDALEMLDNALDAMGDAME